MDLGMQAYGCMSTGDEEGCIEVVEGETLLEVMQPLLQPSGYKTNPYLSLHVTMGGMGYNTNLLDASAAL